MSADAEVPREVLVPVLPDDLDQRKQVFEKVNKFRVERHDLPRKDVGQKYLVMNLGL